jgi:hypothetical protein
MVNSTQSHAASDERVLFHCNGFAGVNKCTSTEVADCSSLSTELFFSLSSAMVEMDVFLYVQS